MGGGDIKLAGVLGLYLGWPNILITLFLSFIIGAVVGLIWVALKKQSLKSALPFGPFLSIATVIVMLWGAQILAWYWQFFI
jgi:leader peptidase (prepilin peptidase)/N-methyltransferase